MVNHFKVMLTLLQASKPKNVLTFSVTPLLVRVALSKVTVNGENTLPQLLQFHWRWLPILMNCSHFKKMLLMEDNCTKQLLQNQQLVLVKNCIRLQGGGASRSLFWLESDRVSSTSKQTILMEDNCSKRLVRNQYLLTKQIFLVPKQLLVLIQVRLHIKHFKTNASDGRQKLKLIDTKASPCRKAALVTISIRWRISQLETNASNERQMLLMEDKC